MSANKHTPMVVAAARALCRRDSDLCGVDFDDNWKLYGDGFLADAQVALESIAAPELLGVAHYCERLLLAYGIDRIDGEEIADAALVLIRSAIAKAGGAA